MALTPTIDTKNLLDVNTTNATSKYMSKTSDSLGFSNVFDKVNKSYSNNSFEKDTQLKTSSAQQNNSTNNTAGSESKSKVDKGEQSSKSDELKETNQLKQNSEAEAGKTSENTRQEQKIQDDKKNQDAELQESIIQNAEESIKMSLKSSLLAQDLQVKELALEPEKIVQNIEVTEAENVENIILDDVPNIDVKQLNTDKDLLSALKTNSGEEISNNTKTISKNNVLENTIEKLPKQELPLTDKQVSLKNSLPEVEIDVSNDKNIVPHFDKNANMIKTEAVVETPHVKVQNDNSVLQNIKTLNDDEKLNAKNILDNKNLNQQKLDDLDVKIKSVVNLSENNKNTNSESSQEHSQTQNFLMHQDVQEQAIRFELQANSDVKTPLIEQDIVQTSSETISSINNVENVNPMQNLNLAKTIELPNNQVQQTQMPKELNSADVMSQIDKQLDAKSIQDSGTTKISIVLKPENLGKLELELVSSKNGLEAKMVASSPQVKEILDKNLDALRESLGNQGVSVNNVTVKVAEAQKSDTMFDFDQHQKNHQGSQKEQTQKSKENDFTNQEFEQDLETEQDNQEEIIYTAAEQTTTISGLNGRVAYKL